MALTRRPTEPFLFEGGGQACLLLHGFSGSPAEVRPLGEYLAARGITVAAPLLPGHPDQLEGHGWPEWARTALCEYDRLRRHYQTVHIVGFSMGGLLGLYLGSRVTPATIAVLGCPVGLARVDTVEQQLARRFRGQPFPVRAARSLVRLARLVRRGLPRVSAPVLMLAGERDPWLVGEERLLNLPHGVVRTMAGMGHFLTLERGREQVYALVHDWMGRASRSEPLVYGSAAPH